MGWKTAPDTERSLEPDERSKFARELRSRGLERLILALSDQQLVTGMAVLIAGYISPCSMSLYHFNIVAALGWFSSTVHLSTLTILRVYFIEHPRLRNWRVISMLVVFGLLAIAQMGGLYSKQNNSLPIQRALIGSLPRSVRAVEAVSIAGIVLFLAVSYINRIMRLSSFDPDWSIQTLLVQGLVAIIRRRTILHNLVTMAVISSKKSKSEQGTAYQIFWERRRHTRSCDILEPKYPGQSRRVAWLLILLQDLQSSFLGGLLTLQFGVALGIAQVVQSRTMCLVGVLSVIRTP